MAKVRLGDLTVAYEQAGSGMPLVLLHGGLSDRREWRRQIQSLSGEMTVVAWDAPGAGESSDPPDPFATGDYADTLAALMRHLALPPAHVAGLSWGGVVAQSLAVRHPALVRTLILADTYAGWKGSLPPDAVAERLASVLRELDEPPGEIAASTLPGLMTADGVATYGDELLAIMRDFHPAGARTMVRSMAATDLTPHLSSIRVPVQLIWGEQDARSPLSVAETFRAAIPDTTLTVIPGAGHQSNIEQSQRFNEIVRAWCRSH